MKLASLVLVASVSALQAFGQETTRKDFDDFAIAQKGRWQALITFITDWPGGGKRGDKVTGYRDCSVIEDGNAIYFRGYASKASHSGFVMYDANTKKILEQRVDSGGTVANIVWSKKGDKWAGAVIGSLVDGSKLEASVMLTFTDKGNTMTVTGSAMIGGKKTDDLQDVYHRVSK
jgi:hypothetical protein